ncbi:kinesin-like protein KIN-12E [Phalaenopsis equestris]|uniref:kinesin-like protein KIN-12E n=1 Tax=Phalaenopsis equestris TaxID=78828 RepID=UPI0009E61366|nr:kinesin-like protein KIN-12E [Phalaenopsis equestris]
MAFQLKTELVISNTANPTLTKSEKGAAKSRGSGSPFKCIVGLAQQINTEKDEELTVARCKVEELEALAASRQNQIFMLNIRLAAAESMTHDVLRDLLGIKLDMTKYAKMNGGSHSDDSMKGKDKELGELKRKVDEFVEERKSLLEEINRRHEELIAAQIRLRKLEENEEFLSTENEILKVDNAKYKNIAMELEQELEKTSIQLNMQ